ncbi:uncharacterized protein K452DRAFT_316904 [Aplosporella prunicola CBS 121167]|uniref:Uncharacterized protein n=1 Tax=Aplosporella prunicola CBS 121167 TaxID=1176127 RepID=A0A6A6BJ48_9PEZI|nr:uncharacterized protein K452DRAFT_316904 [Aplosporella prunicola CBS 121167]KAF2144172.1 hypothetical protein K452DRAFT_316904 [Aplosporella prunicola CBS 121167]
MLTNQLLQAAIMLQLSLPVFCTSSSSNVTLTSSNTSTTQSLTPPLTHTKHVTTNPPSSSPNATPIQATSASNPTRPTASITTATNASAAAATCLTANASCAATYDLFQSCWDTGVSGPLDPNDKRTSSNYRDCVCGDTGTTQADAWSLCAECLRAAGEPGESLDSVNWALWGFCRSPDPNAFLFLLALLDFTTEILGSGTSYDSHSPPLTGAITAVATLASRYSYDPSANILPSGITSVVTAVITPTGEPLPRVTTTTGTGTGTESVSAFATATATAFASATMAETTETETETRGLGAEHGGVSYTTGVYPNGLATLYVVGPAKPVPASATATTTSMGSAAGSHVPGALVLVLLGMVVLGVVWGGVL